MKVFLILLPLLLIACAGFPKRNGYDRTSGSYPNTEIKEVKKTPKKNLDASNKNLNTESENKEVIATKKEQTVLKNETQIAQENAWEKAYKPWLGTPYKYGGSTKKGVDCSGFVMNIYKEVLHLDMPHSASDMYHSGKKVSDLKEGDLVFFGSFWKIDHVGIYLSGDRFVHASSSKGVMISPMNDKYWSGRYQGARRYR